MTISYFIGFRLSDAWLLRCWIERFSDRFSRRFIELKVYFRKIKITVVRSKLERSGVVLLIKRNRIKLMIMKEQISLKLIQLQKNIIWHLFIYFTLKTNNHTERYKSRLHYKKDWGKTFQLCKKWVKPLKYLNEFLKSKVLIGKNLLVIN